MNTQEHKQYLSEFKAFSKEITASREEALQFLMREGIYTKLGKLTKAYTASTPLAPEKLK